MTKDIRDRNALAARWLEQRIKRAIKETEREFGVYISVSNLRTVASTGGGIDDVQAIGMNATIWPASMRIIETERESKAIG